MPKVTITRGYSGSGKSSWARQSGAFIVSRDHIRQQITGNEAKTVLDNAGEQLVNKIEQAQIETALKAGVNVVVDATNLYAKHARRYLDLAVKHGADWEIKDFLVSKEECLARNENRGAAWVPPSVIETQARKFPLGRWPVLTPSVESVPQWGQYVPDETKPRAVAVDLDGTLAFTTGGTPTTPVDTMKTSWTRWSGKC